MNIDLSNSFYYFFSAVPQVLGGVLALFGVFVVFKVQTIKTELIGIAKTVLSKSKKKMILLDKYTDVNGEVKGHFYDHTHLEEQIEKNNITEIQSEINYITNTDYDNYRKNYNDKYEFLATLKASTINASIFTAAIIFIALMVIPFGNFILSYPCFICALFAIVLLAISICLYLFIKVLKKSFVDIK